MRLWNVLSVLLGVAISSISASAAFAAGLQEVYYDNDAASFVLGENVNPATSYSGVAWNSKAAVTDAYSVTKTGGGAGGVYYADGIWNDLVVSLADDSVVYTDLAYNKSASGSLQVHLLTLASGGFSEIYYDGSNWIGSDVVENSGVTYTGVAHNFGDVYLATRADGGVDELHYESGSWVADNYPLGGALFTDVTQTRSDQYMGTLATGGAQEIYYDGSSFVLGDLVGITIYNGIAHRSGTADVFLATRADGGVDELHYENPVWVVDTYSLGGTVLGDITNRGGDFYFATVPAQTVPGDFNLDGSVDAADYVTWRKNPGDFEDEGGYDTWRAHFGEPNSATGSLNNASVPEPGSAGLLAVAALVALVHRGVRRARG